MQPHTLMVRFPSEAAAQEFERWLHHVGHPDTSRSGVDVTMALRSTLACATVKAEAERRGGELAWDEDDSGEPSTLE